MKKKGFTLVELLAVIAILAILVIIALPNVMGMFNTAKQNSFNTEVKEIYKTAQQAWIMKNMSGAASNVTYKRVNGTYTGDSLDLTGRTQLDFKIVFDSAGKVTEYRASDGTFYYLSGNTTDLKVEDISGSKKWADKPQCKANDTATATDCTATTILDQIVVD